jgi:hypothetical protein
MGHQTRFSQSTTCSHPAMPINARRDKLSLSIHELLAMSNQKHGPTGPSSGSPSAPLKHTHRGRNRNKILIPDNYLSNRSSTQRQRNPPLQARVKRCFSLDTFCHAELHVDEIVVMVSEERRALMSAGPMGGGSECETNFGKTSLGAPQAVSSRVARYSFTGRCDLRLELPHASETSAGYLAGANYRAIHTRKLSALAPDSAEQE